MSSNFHQQYKEEHFATICLITAIGAGFYFVLLGGLTNPDALLSRALFVLILSLLSLGLYALSCGRSILEAIKGRVEVLEKKGGEVNAGMEPPVK